MKKPLLGAEVYWNRYSRYSDDWTTGSYGYVVHQTPKTIKIKTHPEFGQGQSYTYRIQKTGDWKNLYSGEIMELMFVVDPMISFMYPKEVNDLLEVEWLCQIEYTKIKNHFGVAKFIQLMPLTT
jgi:hypothetical protein